MLRYTASRPQPNAPKSELKAPLLSGSRHVWPAPKQTGKFPSSDLKRLVEDISAATGISIEDIYSERRMRPIAHARQAAMWLARYCTPWSIPKISRHFRKDHTTVLHAVRKIDARRQTSPKLAAMLDEIKAKYAHD